MIVRSSRPPLTIRCHMPLLWVLLAAAVLRTCGTLAQFVQITPSGLTSVALDADGTLYFTHASDSYISAVTATGLHVSYNIMTARASQLGGLAADPTTSSLYIADSLNHVIVCMNTSTGEQLAEYATSEPPLDKPYGVAVDGVRQRLYVADTGNSRVVVLDSVTGAQLAVYVTSEPALSLPMDVALDAAGCMYVADAGNDRVVKLDGTSGAVVGVFTASGPSLSGPTGVALDADGKLYISDHAHDRIVVLNPMGLQLAVLDASSPALSQPNGIVVSAERQVYVADTGNDRVVEWSESAYTATQYPIDNVSYWSLEGMAVDSAGCMYVTCSAEQQLIKLDVTGAVLLTVSIGGPASGVVLDAAGDMYVPTLNRLNRTYNALAVAKLNASGGIVAYYTTSAPSAPRGVAMDSAGSVYLVDEPGGRILKLNGTTGDELAVFNASKPVLREPQDVAVDAAGFIYISDPLNRRVLKLSPNGEQVAAFETSRPPLSRATGVAVDTAGCLYVADGSRLVKLNATTGALLATFTGALSLPVGVAVDSDGNIYVADSYYRHIVKFSVHSWAVSAVHSPVYAELRIPAVMALNSAGDVFVANAQYGPILKLTAVGAKVVVYSTSDAMQQSGLAVDAAGGIYVADAVNDCVWKLNATGEVVGEYTTTSPPMNAPGAVAVDAALNVYIADTGNNRVVKMDASGAVAAVYITSDQPLSSPSSVAVNAAGFIFVADTDNNRVVKLDSTGVQVAVYNTTQPALRLPRSVSVDAAGNVYIAFQASTGDGAVVKLDSTGVQVAAYKTTTPRLWFSRAVAADSAGNVHLLDSGLSRVVQLNATGTQVAEYPRRRSSAWLYQPASVSVDAAGDMYVTQNYGYADVAKLSPTSEPLEYSTAPGMGLVRGIWVDRVGDAYVAHTRSSGGWSVAKLNATGGWLQEYATSNPTGGGSGCVAVDSAGNVYVADNHNSRAVKLNATGAQVGVYTTSSPALGDDMCIWVDDKDSVYVSDAANDRVVKFNTTTGAVSHIYTTSNPPLSYPTGVAVNSAGEVLVVDSGNKRVVQLSSSGVLLAAYTVHGPSLRDPMGMWVDAAGTLFVADYGEARIVSFADSHCPAGYYCPLRTPVLCPERYYCPHQPVNMFASPSILPCEAGHYCPAGSVEQLTCPASYYCSPASVQPLPCPAGYYCLSGADDPTVGLHDATGRSGLCPLGHYCPYMTGSALQCPEMTYGDQQGLIDATCSGHCAAGTYWGSPGQTTADCSGECAAGQYCPFGNNAQPLPCPGGSFCPTTTTLRSCMPGYYGSKMGLTDPHCSGPCEPGFVCTENSITARQLPCPPGQYNEQYGQSRCVQCAAGWYAESSVNGTTACSRCARGTSSSVNGSSQCSPCSPGSYAADEGQATCTLCAAGTYAEAGANGTVACTECPAGQHSPSAGASMCQYCPAGQYNNRTGQATCIDCPAGTAAADNSTERVSCSACPLGHFAASGRCEACPRSTYSLLAGSVQCSSCNGIAGVECEGGIAYVDRAYHAAVEVHIVQSAANSSSIDVALTTQRCPDGYCVGVNSTVFSALLVDATSYLDTAPTAQPIVLSLPQQCSSCRSQSPTSPLCGVCQPGYAPADVGSPRSGCVACAGVSYVKLLLLVTTSWLLVLVYYVASNGRLGLISCALYYAQTIAIMLSSNSSLTAWLRTFSFSPVAIMPSVCLGPMSAEWQYAMPLLIVPLQMVQLCITVCVHALLKRRCAVSPYQLDERTMTYVMSGDSEQAAAMQSERWYGRLAQVVRYRVWPEMTVSTVVRTSFLVLSASFTSVLVTCVSWFHCTADSTMGDTQQSSSVVYAFPAIACRTSRYVLWSWVMGGCVVVWLVGIVVSGWWLVRHRRQLAVLQSRSGVDSDVQSERAVARPLALRPEAQTEQAVGELRVPLMARLPLSRYWPTVVVANESWDEPVCDSGMDGVRMETRREYAFRSLYGALYDSFRAGASGWMVVVWLRRLLLILLSVALTTLPTAKYLSFLLLHLAIFCLQGYFQPFSTAALNDVEQVSILVHLIIAGVLTAYPSPTDAAIQSVILTLTIAPPVSYVLYGHAHSLLLKAKQHTAKRRARERQQALSVSLLSSDELEVS